MLLVLESTYGNRLHARIPAGDVLGMYLNIILKRDGVAIIPSFSVGRTQDILYLIKKLAEDKKIPDVPVILDSPLSSKANKIFLRSVEARFIKEEVFDDISSQAFPNKLQVVQSVQESIDSQKQEGPLIIVSASGMIDGGRVVHHIKKRISNRKNGVILVGFQPQGTKGRILLDGEKTLRLHKQEFPVKADIFYVNSLSAHADYLDTLEWLKESQVRPALTILNHGEPNASENLRNLLNSELELKSTVASLDEEFTFV